MRVRRFSAVATVLLAGLSTSLPAQADTGLHVVAPYTDGWADGEDNCLPGSSCTETGSADGRSGAAVAGVDIQRSSADATTQEHATSYAQQAVDLRVPKGATSARATFTWTVRNASTRATAEQGVLYVSAGLSAYASCGTCAVSGGVAFLVSSSSSVPRTDNASSVSDVQRAVTVTVDNLSRGAKLRIYSGPSLYASMDEMPVCTGLDPCEALPPVEAGHAGTAHAYVDATLTSIDVSYS